MKGKADKYFNWNIEKVKLPILITNRNVLPLDNMGVNGLTGKATERDRESLNQLVLDCSMYNFDEKDTLELY